MKLKFRPRATYLTFTNLYAELFQRYLSENQ